MIRKIFNGYIFRIIFRPKQDTTDFSFEYNNPINVQNWFKQN